MKWVNFDQKATRIVINVSAICPEKIGGTSVHPEDLFDRKFYRAVRKELQISGDPN